MSKLPAISGQQAIRALEKIGFEIIRQKGSHVRLKDEDERVTTIPIHPGKTLGKGLLRKIIGDVELTVEEFIELL
ncbi:type II toxin-antitoxin system HicA family toxin [Roseofilum casamattae]|uniref:Type II toxin-antitoxin system HicA family toxin n=1 Tax=Roseofilum casamattae BLCC-M143 TaxID=3022442 RepID=A0ABT7C0J8_9CYAN|nr:type II toxin-antitoxin system HicA family toxin [Roseofilum casamattae]MDJ1184972.1 type II toxin-antitoxin system HicA family toxin [Roseofilum casamattae BLCC-M143]MDJ1184974.1 type II toxin-antitoxin system HicA family toxin [Roseofilum casamattae BLCC-M143]